MRAQVAMEFIIILCFTLIILAAAVGISFQKSIETESERMRLEAEQVLYAAASAINMAHAEGDGFSTAFSLPASVGGANYTIETSSTLIWMEAAGSFYAETLLTDNVTGAFVPGENTVRNAGGGIRLNG